MAFAVLVSVAAGTVAGLLTGGITAAFAPAHVAVATGVASLVLFTVAPAQGWLQGELRFTRYAVASILEVAVRLGFSAVAVLLGWGPAGALLGFAVGGLVLVAGPLAMLRDVGWHPHVLREGVRWAETGDIALVQFVVSVLVGADVVLVALLGSGTAAEAGFQALATLAKGPVYVASGTVLVAFPLLRAGGPRDARGRAGAGAALVRGARAHRRRRARHGAQVAGDALPARQVPRLDGPAAAAGRRRAGLRRRHRARHRAARPADDPPHVRRAGRRHGAPRGRSRRGLGAARGERDGGRRGRRRAERHMVLAVLAAPALPRGTLGSTMRTVLVAAVLLVVLLLTARIPVLWLVCATVGGLLALRPDLVSRAAAPEVAPMTPAIAGAARGRGDCGRRAAFGDRLRPCSRGRAWLLAAVLGLVAFAFRAIGLTRATTCSSTSSPTPSSPTPSRAASCPTSSASRSSCTRSGRSS